MASRALVRDYGEELRLFRGRGRKIGLLAIVALYIWLPLSLDGNVPLQLDGQWSGIFVLAGITAIGALGLNLLTGYAGQPSLGNAAFIGVGAFTAGYFGRDEVFGTPSPGQGWPFLGYFALAAVIGAVIGLAVGLPALRLRGNYLIIVTLGLVFVGLYVFKSWDEVTGGNAGSSMPADIDILGISFTKFDVFGRELERDQSLFYLVWLVVGVVGLLLANVVRSRPGRALQAVRDRDVAAEVVGVSLTRYKLAAFVLASAILAMAGVLYGVKEQFLQPDESSLGLTISIQYLAIIIIGGIGTTYGPVLGALLVAIIPKIVSDYAGSLPLVTESPATESGISKGALVVALNAILIIVFLVTEPNGLAGLLRRVKAYFASWPL
jgi:branched-chain amino acid transport system permease protein